MVLSQPDLKKEVRRGTLKFDPPIEEDQWGSTSIDLRLGFTFSKIKPKKGLKLSVAEGLAASSDLWIEKILQSRDSLDKRECYTLEPGEFVLARTLELVTVPNHLIGHVEGRSTYARVGLSMHQTAPWIHPGFSNFVVLEIMNNGPITIELTPEIDRPCQLTFFTLSKRLTKDKVYGAKKTDRFQKQNSLHGKK